ncbi:helix-turn-helix domain-containing protein [Faecalibacter rhinopitheci]|uniref:AAA family ATPase n=1 Tax=Faecalibacter rhinopitheci TaxID=2779678 RepID=A0A8J7FNL4_9FLAO|nr:helix-turn-helix domain-containing protein [Faecalibacter rhinopitheci]MBF0596364.1 AAA family ATPase [Faecalibacter rhinopitheci]
MQQSKALAILKSGRNVFLTGSAGAGKTYVLNQYIKYLKQHGVPVAITASTGIAATHMNGQTIHSWAGIGIKDYVSDRYLASLRDKKYFRDKMDKVKVLIIDEISMLHRAQLDAVDYVLKFFKQNDEPFGGIQVVFSGDFFQLPPIGEEWEEARDKFCFMSDAWVGSKAHICYLTEQYRQTNNALNDILNEIRSGMISDTTVSLLESRIEYFPDEIDAQTRLYTHNMDVDRINKGQLHNIDSSAKIFEAKVAGNPALVEVLKKSVLADESLELKIGAKVMFVRNNFDVGYVNGTLGNVSGYTEKDEPIIKTLDGEFHVAKPETWAIEDESGKALASFTQVPLRLAWAITIHKSQGMTLDSAFIDLSKAFEKGQGYVALSRLRDLNSLTLHGLNQTALEIDSLAMKADRRFQELSHLIDEKLDEKELQDSWASFIRYSGGTLDKKQIAKNVEKNKTKEKGQKKSTYEITLEYLREGLNLEEIAERRGLSTSAIVDHIGKIKETETDIDYDKFKPSNLILDKVRLAYSEIEFEENKILKPIFDFLGGEVSYEDIKKALLFID